MAARRAVGVVAFASTADVLVPLSHSHADLRAAIRTIEAGGGTQIDLGLLYAQGVLANEQSGRRGVVWLMSDGRQSSAGGDRTAIEAAASLKEAGYTVFAVGLGGASVQTLDAMASSPTPAQPVRIEDQIDELFERWDADGSGAISLAELNHVLKWLFLDGTMASKLTMQAADTDGDGVLSRAELGAWLHGQEKAGGPAVATLVPVLLNRLREEAEAALMSEALAA